MTMKTPAMMNQYGEMCTGMPNGFATTKPLWREPRCFACSSWPLATSPMLRAFGGGLVAPARLRAPGWDRTWLRNVGGLAYGGLCGLGKRSGRGDRYRQRGRLWGGGRPAVGAVAVAGGRLHDLPAAVPVPGDRPDPRAADHRDRPRHAGARRPRAAVRPARRRADPGRGAGHADTRVDPAVRGRRAAGGADHRRRGAGPVRGRRRLGPAGLLQAGGPAAARARRAGVVRGDVAAIGAEAARLHRPGRRDAGRRPADRGLQDRPGAARGLRGERAVPDEVLRAGDLAAARGDTEAAAADVPVGRRRGAALLPRRGGPARHRAEAQRALGRDLPGPRDRRLPAPAEQAVRLVPA